MVLLLLLLRRRHDPDWLSGEGALHDAVDWLSGQHGGHGRGRRRRGAELGRLGDPLAVGDGVGVRCLRPLPVPATTGLLQVLVLKAELDAVAGGTGSGSAGSRVSLFSSARP